MIPAHPTALACLLLPLFAAAAEPPTPTSERAEEYAVDRPKNVIALQQFRESASMAMAGPGGRRGTATLTSLNPHIGAWHLLRLDWADGESTEWHLKNPAPRRLRLALDPAAPGGLSLDEGGRMRACPLWSEAPGALARAADEATPFAPLCGGAIHLLNRVKGRRTNLERVTELIREKAPGGETLIGFVKRRLYADAFRDGAAAAKSAAAPLADPGAPPPARVAAAMADRAVAAPNLGIEVEGGADGMRLGRWRPAAGLDGVWAGVMLPGAVAPEILASHRDRVNALDGVEDGALVYLAAFDLGGREIGWAAGTDYPGVGWSPRPPASVRKPGLPGPDGFDTLKPLVTTGMLDPIDVPRAVATFTGGFKRHHGAFKYGELASSRKGHHYGSVQQGVVLSKLQPDLATLYVLRDGGVDMKTWTEADQRLLPFIRSALQNGVPLIVSAGDGAPVPGPLVNRWGPGNWSGSAKAELRAIRAGACLVDSAARRFLIYAYFSSATPSAMARVFQGYGCRYAMLLDMNAPVHTYLALYPRRDGEVVVQHLVAGMEEADMTRGGALVPRFLGFPDNRDFFYVLEERGAR